MGQSSLATERQREIQRPFTPVARVGMTLSVAVDILPGNKNHGKTPRWVEFWKGSLHD